MGGIILPKKLDGDYLDHSFFTATGEVVVDLCLPTANYSQSNDPAEGISRCMINPYLYFVIFGQGIETFELPYRHTSFVATFDKFVAKVGASLS